MWKAAGDFSKSKYRGGLFHLFRGNVKNVHFFVLLYYNFLNDIKQYIILFTSILFAKHNQIIPQDFPKKQYGY